MLNPSIYTWFSAYRAAVLEPDFTLIPERVREALKVVHERLNGLLKLTKRNDKPLLMRERAWRSSTRSQLANGNLGRKMMSQSTKLASV